LLYALFWQESHIWFLSLKKTQTALLQTEGEKLLAGLDINKAREHLKS